MLNALLLKWAKLSVSRSWSVRDMLIFTFVFLMDTMRAAQQGNRSNTVLTLQMLCSPTLLHAIHVFLIWEKAGFWSCDSTASTSTRGDQQWKRACFIAVRATSARENVTAAKVAIVWKPPDQMTLSSSLSIIPCSANILWIQRIFA